MKNSRTQVKNFEISPLAKAGVLVIDIKSNGLNDEHDIYTPHKDNHYLLLAGTKGKVKILLDFEEVLLTAPVIMLINPGQVHHIIEVDKLEGWVVSFEAVLVDSELQKVLESEFRHPFRLDQSDSLYKQLVTLIGLIFDIQSDTSHISTKKVLQELLRALLSLVTGRFSSNAADSKGKIKRNVIIEQEFGRLLKVHYNSWKPAQFAKALSISVAHLNDTIKSISGSPVSAHIQQKAILEAKRLLYFTNLTVQEISYQTGYENPIYFSKLFRKITSLTPSQFRRQIRD